MNCGTFQPSLTAGAARPGFDGSCVGLSSTLGTSHAMPGARDGIFTSIIARQAWNRMWAIEAIDAKPAYPVAHTDRLNPRPLERSP